MGSNPTFVNNFFRSRSIKLLSLVSLHLSHVSLFSLASSLLLQQNITFIFLFRTFLSLVVEQNLFISHFYFSFVFILCVPKVQRVYSLACVDYSSHKSAIAPNFGVEIKRPRARERLSTFGTHNIRLSPSLSLSLSRGLFPPLKCNTTFQ